MDCVDEDFLYVDEYVNDTKSIHNIISYQDPNDIQLSYQDSEDDQFIGGILESSKRYKDRQIDDIEKLEQVESMLTFLG